VSQPTLSTHIQQLEEELGTELFARVGRNVRLTEAGLLFLDHARLSVRELEVAGEEINAINGLLRGTLHIAALPLFSSVLLPGWIASFNAVHPDVRIQARSGSSEDIEADLMSGALDLGFAISPVEHSDINTKELFSNEVVMVFSHTHPLAKKRKLEPTDLQALPIATSSHRLASARLLRKYFDELGVQPNIVVEYDDAHALLEIAKLGSLVTFLPMTGFIEAQHLRWLKLPDPGVHLTAVALWNHCTPAGKAFLKIAAAEVKNFQPAAS